MTRYGLHYVTEDPERIVSLLKKHDRTDTRRLAETGAWAKGHGMEPLPAKGRETLTAQFRSGVLSVWSSEQEGGLAAGWPWRRRYGILGREELAMAVFQEDGAFMVTFWRDGRTVVPQPGQNPLADRLREGGAAPEGSLETDGDWTCLMTDLAGVDAMEGVLGFPLLLPAGALKAEPVSPYVRRVVDQAGRVEL